MENKQNIKIKDSSKVSIGSINFNAEPKQDKQDLLGKIAIDKKQIKERIAKNEIKAVITLLLNSYEDSSQESNVLYSILHRVEALQEQVMKGIASEKEANLERNRIANILLDFVAQCSE